MKTKITAILILFLVVFACISRKEIIKRFDKNGTIEVTVNTYEEDTNYLHNRNVNPFPMRTDQRWNLSFKRDTGNKIRCTAIRNFSSLIMLKKNFNLNNSKWEKSPHELYFKKKFRWFYTYYVYTEIFYKINHFDLSPKGYLTPEEIEIWKKRDDALIKNVYDKKNDSLNSAINDKAENWLKDCFKKELVINLKKALEILNDPSLKPSIIESNIDTILRLSPGDFSTKKLIAAMAGYFRNEKVYQLLDKKYSFINSSETTYRSVVDNFYEEAVFEIIMPGRIIKNNAEKINHDTLCWSVTAYRFFFSDYELKATTRVVNNWSLWVTGILIVLLTGILIKFWKPGKDNKTAIIDER
jgi:hypothetical protein